MEGLNIENKAEVKSERYKIREQISGVLANIGLTGFGENVDTSEAKIEIRLGEVQSDDFMKRTKEILDNSDFWDSLPNEQESSSVLHGVKYVYHFDKQSSLNELRILVEQHDALEE